MKHTVLQCFVVVGLLLALEGTAAAGPVWSVDWPSGTSMTSFLSPSGRTALDVTFLNVSGNAQSTTGTIADLAIVHRGTEALPSHPITKSYSFSLRLTDLTSGVFDTLHFTGYLRVIATRQHVTIANVLTSSATFSNIVLGDNLYTLSIGPFDPPDIGGSFPGSLGVRVTYSPVTTVPDPTTTTTTTLPQSGSGRPPVSSSPEPSSLLLGSIGLAFLGLVSCRRRKM